MAFNEKIFKFANNLDKNGIKYQKSKARAIESRNVDPTRRSELLKEAKLKADQSEGRSDLRNLYEEGIRRHNKYD